MLRLLLLFSLAASTAFAGDTELAVEASEAHQQWCAQAGQGDVLLASKAIGPVSDVWGRVSEAWETGGSLSLLYWRGMLGQCLSQEELASKDFASFITRAEDEPALRSQVQDAKRRLKRMGAVTGAAPRVNGKPVLIAIGVGTGAAAGLLGGLSAWQWAELQDNWVSLTRDPHPVDEGASLLAAAQESETHQRAFLAAAIGAGVGAATLLVVGAVVPEGAPAVSVSPMPGGAALSIGGAW